LAGTCGKETADAGDGVLAAGVALTDAPRACLETGSRACGKLRGARGMTTTVLGASLNGPPNTTGSTNGTGSGVSASDHSRADPTTHAAATNTAANRRVPTTTSSRTARTAWTRRRTLKSTYARSTVKAVGFTIDTAASRGSGERQFTVDEVVMVQEARAVPAAELALPVATPPDMRRRARLLVATLLLGETAWLCAVGLVLYWLVA
jgi:hypothetical protein